MKKLAAVFLVLFSLLSFTAFLSPQKASAAPTCQNLTFFRVMGEDPRIESGTPHVLFNLANPAQKEIPGGTKLGWISVLYKDKEVSDQRNLKGILSTGTYNPDTEILTAQALLNTPIFFDSNPNSVFIKYGVYGPKGEEILCKDYFKEQVNPYNSAADPGRPGADPQAPQPSTAPISEDDARPIPTEICPEYTGFTLDPCIVSASTRNVDVIINDVPPLPQGDDRQYYYCLKTDPRTCGKKDINPVNNIPNGGYDPATGTISLPCLAGNGPDKLKFNPGCRTSGENDWFHRGKTYRISIFDEDETAAYTRIEAAFFVTHFYPEIKLPKTGSVESLNEKKIKDSKVKVYEGIKIQLARRNREGGGDGQDKYNDYYVRIDGYDVDYNSKPVCVLVPKTGTSREETIEMPVQHEDSNGRTLNLTAGKYLLKIFDAKEGCEEGNFVYYYIPITIGSGDSDGFIAEAIIDPKNKELFVDRTRKIPEPICPPEDTNNAGFCTKIPTALGIKISTEPGEFVRDVFTLVLSLGGIASVVFFIQAGYKIMNSGGNKEKVAEAREQITAAIMGLIFIILSITILEFIGINILHIPGFE